MATISLAIILRAVMAVIAGPMTRIPPSPFGSSVITFGGVAVSTLDMFIILSAVVLVVVFYLFFNRTKWGIAMKATAEDPMAAHLVGIPVKKSVPQCVDLLYGGGHHRRCFAGTPDTA